MGREEGVKGALEALGAGRACRAGSSLRPPAHCPPATSPPPSLRPRDSLLAGTRGVCVGTAGVWLPPLVARDGVPALPAVATSQLPRSFQSCLLGLFPGRSASGIVAWGCPTTSSLPSSCSTTSSSYSSRWVDGDGGGRWASDRLRAPLSQLLSPVCRAATIRHLNRGTKCPHPSPEKVLEANRCSRRDSTAGEATMCNCCSVSSGQSQDVWCARC